MRADGSRVVRIIVSAEEDKILAWLRVQGEYKTDANVLRDALWSMAEESGCPGLKDGLFAFKKAGNPQPWQAWAGTRAKHAAKPTVQLKPAVMHTRKPAKMHPWRQYAINPTGR